MNVVMIKLCKSELNIIGGERDKYWVNLKGIDTSKKYRFDVEIGESDKVTVECDINDASNSESDELEKLFITFLIDEIASEVLELSKQFKQTDKSLQIQIHLELIKQRSKSILVRLDAESSNSIRLKNLMGIVDKLNSGEKIDQLKLTDIKFEGKYETKDTNNVSNIQYKSTQINPSSINQKVKKTVEKWTTISTKRGENLYPNTDTHSIKQVMWRVHDLSFDKNMINFDHIFMAASTGDMPVIEKIIELIPPQSQSDIDYQSTHNGLNIVDVVIIFGYYRTLRILLKNGLKPSCDSRLLLRTALSRGYVITGRILVDYDLVTITDGMIDSAPNNVISQWLINNRKEGITMVSAISKGMYEYVVNNINSEDKISWNQFPEILIKSSMEHQKIVRLLLEKSICDVNQVFDYDDDVAWPLFLAGRYGQVDMIDIILEFSPQINLQNRKGTTALWIACCNKHTDIVMKLLISGADPNLTNFKGDSPLIPAIQKSSQSIAKLLLESGINLNSYNINRDSPIILCCRNGQHKILEMCLDHIDKSQQQLALELCADIDGFNALIAATEQDRVECIRVCHRYGANLEFRTSNTNSILAGATALHIACFYGKLNSVQTLCELGADLLSVTSKNKYTLLHLVIKHGHRHLMPYLMDKCKECMNMLDADGYMPIHYAKMAGNEAILEDFFTDKLTQLITNVLFGNNSIECKERCIDTIVSYGKSIGCYEYDQILNMNIDQIDLMSMAILSKNNYMICNLKKILGENLTEMSLFWANYFGYSDFPCSENTIQMIGRVKKINANNLQNRMLTNLDGCFPINSIDKQIDKKQIDKQPMPDTIQMMSDGFNSKVNDDVILALERSQKNTHTILGFIDKLNTMKILPANMIDYILWDAKINMIKLIANGEIILQPIHLIVIHLYTSNSIIYHHINSTLSNWIVNSVWHPFIYCLNQGLNLAKIFEGEVYRAIDHIFDPSLYTIGSKIISNCFSLGMSEWGACSELINSKRGMIYIIKSLTGRSISAYSKNPMNAEVIFLPKTEFIVTDLYVGNIFCLGQKNIRKTTYKATELDIQKASRSEICIIIEMEEVSKE